VYNEHQFFYTWYSAVIDNHVATGWGEVIFSASSAEAPFRSRPDDEVGKRKKGKKGKKSAVTGWPPVYTQKTSNGEVFVNADTKKYGFVPKT